METSLAETLIQQGIDDLTRALPELATRLGTSKRDWNPPGEDVFTRQALIRVADQLGAAVDSSRIPPALRRDIEHFRFGAAVASRSTPDPVISPAEGPHVSLLWFLLHDHPLDTPAALADFIARLSKIDDHTQRLAPVARVVDKETIAAQCDALLETGAAILAENAEIRAYRAGISSRLDSAALGRQFQQVIAASCDTIASFPESQAGAAPGYANVLFRYTSRDLPADEIHSAALATIKAKAAPHQRGAQDAHDQSLLDRASAALLDNEAAAQAAAGRDPGSDLDISLLPEPFDLASLTPATFHRGIDINTLHLSPDYIGAFGIEATMLRYGLPGAHLLPSSRLSRVIPVPAVAEGWPLYALTLMEHPRSAQHVQFEAVRAAIDTGIHAMDWKHDQAVEFAVRHLDIDTGFAERLVKAALAEPGAGTSAFAGYRMFEELEAGARARLGSGFDRSQFTEALIGEGERPYAVIKSRVDALSSQATAP